MDDVETLQAAVAMGVPLGQLWFVRRGGRPTEVVVSRAVGDRLMREIEEGLADG